MNDHTNPEFWESLSDDEFEKQLRRKIAEGKRHPLYAESRAFREEIAALERKADAFEETLAAEVSNALLSEIEIDGHLEKAKAAYAEMRRQAIAGALGAAPDPAAMLKLAKELIAVEKAHNQHNPDDWKELEGLL